MGSLQKENEFNQRKPSKHESVYVHMRPVGDWWNAMWPVCVEEGMLMVVARIRGVKISRKKDLTVLLSSKTSSKEYFRNCLFSLTTQKPS